MGLWMPCEDLDQDPDACNLKGKGLGCPGFTLGMLISLAYLL